MPILWNKTLKLWRGSSQSRITESKSGSSSCIPEALSRWHLPQQQPFSGDHGDCVASLEAGLHQRADIAV